MLTPELILYVNGVLFVAASLLLLAGFGFMMLAVPALVIVLPPQVVVPMLMMVWLPMGVVLIWSMRKDIDGRILLGFSLPALLGIPVGAVLLRDADAVVMQRVIGALMILLAIVLQLKPGAPIQREGPFRTAAGALSGLQAASTSVAGPFVVLLGLKQRWDPDMFRATLVAFFFVVSIASLPFYWQMDLLSRGTSELAVTSLPGVAAGYATGAWLKRRVSIEAFRWVAVGVVAGGGLVAVLF